MQETGVAAKSSLSPLERDQAALAGVLAAEVVEATYRLAPGGSLTFDARRPHRRFRRARLDGRPQQQPIRLQETD